MTRASLVLPATRRVGITPIKGQPDHHLRAVNWTSLPGKTIGSHGHWKKNNRNLSKLNVNSLVVDHVPFVGGQLQRKTQV